MKNSIMLFALLFGGASQGQTHDDGERAPPSLRWLDPTGAPNKYHYATLHGEAFPSPGTSIYLYQDGELVGKAVLSSAEEPPMLQELDAIEASFSPAKEITAGVIFSGRDLNPGGKYKARAATESERAEIIALGDAPSRKANAPPFENVADRSGVLTIVTDMTRSRHDVAIYTSEISTTGANGLGCLASYVGIFVRGLSGKWRISHINSHTGCDACEGQRSSWSLVGFGDVRATGKLTLLFLQAGYESWWLSGYALADGNSGAWIAR